MYCLLCRNEIDSVSRRKKRKRIDGEQSGTARTVLTAILDTFFGVDANDLLKGGYVRGSCDRRLAGIHELELLKEKVQALGT